MARKRKVTLKLDEVEREILFRLSSQFLTSQGRLVGNALRELDARLKKPNGEPSASPFPYAFPKRIPGQA